MKSILSKDEKISVLRNNGQGGLCEFWALLDGMYFPRRGNTDENWNAAVSAMKEVRGSTMKHFLSPESKKITKLWTDDLLTKLGGVLHQPLLKVFALPLFSPFFLRAQYTLMMCCLSLIPISTGGVLEC